jgi:hypothetical protein
LPPQAILVSDWLISKKKNLSSETTWPNELNEHYLLRTFHRSVLQSFGSLDQAVSEEKIKMSTVKR